MSLLKKILLVVVGVFAILAIGLGIFVAGGPKLPADTDAIIEEVMAAPLPELVTGDTGSARSGEIEIWYEVFRTPQPPKGTILLVMGALSGALVWPDFIIQPLRDAGYQVIRYDHRGVGMSDWIADWDKDHPYTLEDMAVDAVAVLDAVGVDKAHVIGVSMGGMIGQRMAISHADRVRSLTSISSSGYLEDPALAPEDPPSNLNMLRLFIKYGLWPSERNTIKLSVGFVQLIIGDGGAGLEVKPIAEQVLYELRNRRGYNPRIWDQHVGAIFASGSRYDELGTIRVPTLIVHGTADIAIPMRHGQRCAELIPGAKTLWLDGVGHIIPRSHADTLLDSILATIDGETESTQEPIKALGVGQ